MSIPDELMGQWFRLAADLDDAAVLDIESDLASGSLHPNAAKRRLAREVVSLYWGDGAAETAESAFDIVFRDGGAPDEIAEHKLATDDPVHLPSLIRDVFDMSGSEARRMIEQGAVRGGDQEVETQELSRATLGGRVLRVGKRRFARLVG
jgi:tyrosyl-tRNA synthetase